MFNIGWTGRSPYERSGSDTLGRALALACSQAAGNSVTRRGR